jgi:hypothetical protein
MTLTCGSFRHLVFQVRPTLQCILCHRVAKGDDAGQEETLTKYRDAGVLIQPGCLRLHHPLRVQLCDHGGKKTI